MEKPRLSFWQIWNMSFGFLGIQFGFALQNANVSRIFETLGAEIDNIPILWIAAPVSGLIIQPIIGHMSDNTWTRLGRRRPYFLAGAIMASLALIIMPNSPTLWMAAGMLWIMDASINVSMEPFRAFVGDMLPPDQRTTGFATQSFFIGTGAVVASALPYVLTNWLGIPNTAAEGIIPPSVKYSFYIGGIIFMIAIVWTVLKTKEYPPDELAQFDNDEGASLAQPEQGVAKVSTFLNVGLVLLALGIGLTLALAYVNAEKEVYILAIGLIVFGLIEVIVGWMSKSGISNGLTSIITDLNNMPVTMKQLAVVQFFSWFALFAMWIYSTAAITSHVYGTQDATSQLYNDGADWVGVLFSVYNGAAALLAFGLIWLAGKTSRKITHTISLIIGGVSFISISFIKSPELLVIPFLGVGLVWASILAMPYAILAGAIPGRKMGVYMGIFNFFIVIPQICAASLLGFLVKRVFEGEAIYALIIGGVSFMVAAVMVLLVKDEN
ncbi:MFS transporter [uncultured Imperialibacter sp.]|uniref:MFS transporter n=1 Tax=uncultured Imperialibacter sp. TaxID=1672639 RepID=UPI0030DD6639|tara:strand:+ start:8611 stop:10098 length:1488 start_codon:yes stop_codon:yes gene_type:complete